MQQNMQYAETILWEMPWDVGGGEKRDEKR
jgi:hypothetical protein